MIDDRPVPTDVLDSGSLESAVRRLGVNLVGASIESYHITSLLGVGGMGEVHRARDTKLDRDVAIKVLPAECIADPERCARFQREAQVLATLNHPNIAHIYGFEAGAIVLELVEGLTLAELIARGPIPVRREGRQTVGANSVQRDECGNIAEWALARVRVERHGPKGNLCEAISRRGCGKNAHIQRRRHETAVVAQRG